MSIDTAIRRFRRRQEAQFTQRATIQRPVGEPVYDPEAQVSAQPVETVDTDVPCKITSGETQGSDVAAGQTSVRVTELVVKFPVATDARRDDIVTISDSLYDEPDIGRQYRITDVDRREWQIARRCAIEETSVAMLNLDEGS